MWRQLLKLRRCTNLFNRNQTRRNLARSFFVLNAAQIINVDLPPQDARPNYNNIEIDYIQFTNEMKDTCLKNDEAISNLIKTLNVCIEEICEQYQHCIARQIEITLVCMSLDPVGSHWEELTKYRVEADDLKFEFDKYSMLVERMGQIISNQVYSAVLTGNNEVKCAVTCEYEGLKSLVTQKSIENQDWDSKLLDAKKQSILSGVH